MHFISISLTLFLLDSLYLRGNVITAQGSSGGYQHCLGRHENEHDLLEKQKIVKKLFVFGDSYADTGNNPKLNSSSWKEPYGITFPGEPSGRYSDGLVLTDFIAKHLGSKSPVAYSLMKDAGKSTRFGINFAFGGSGVFDNSNSIISPNMTTQISFFENLLNDSIIFNQQDLQFSSIVLVTLSGNDYSYYFTQGGSETGLPTFIGSVVNQLATNLKRLYELGARKIVVAGLQPLGCLPQRTIATSYKQCNESQNAAVNLHNQFLQQAISKLNNETADSTFRILDLYSSFTTVIENKGPHSGSSKFETPLEPCCTGTSQEYSCGQVNEEGKMMYTVCDYRNSAFFWDGLHPTQAGWGAVYSTLLPTLKQIL